MKIKLAILCLLINTLSVSSQELDTNLPFAPVQLEKGYICGLEIGLNFRKLLQADIEAKVESFMAEGDYYLRYHLDIFECGTVSVEVDDNDNIIRLSTTLTDYSTKEGAKVGMSLRELKKIYPDAYLVFQIDTIGFFYSFVIDELGAFTIDASSISEQCGEDHPDCEKYMLDLKSHDFFTF